MPLSQVRAATAGLMSLAQTIAVPADHRPVRLPSFPNMERTGILNFSSTGTTGVTGARKAVVIRSPTFPLWTEQTICSGADFVSLIANFSATSVPTTTGVDTRYDPPDWGFEAFSCTGGIVAAAARYPIGHGNDKMWMYTPAPAQRSIALTFSGAVGFTAVITTECWSAQGEFQEAEFSIASAAAASHSLVLPNAATPYWRLKSITLRAPTATVSLQILEMRSIFAAGVFYLYPLFQPAEYYNSVLPYSNTRVTAVSALFTNVTRVLAKEGTVLCARVPCTAIDFFNFNGTEAAFTNVHPAEKYYGPMEKGLYSFVLPEQSTSVFQDCVGKTLFGGVSIPIINLDRVDYANLILFTDLEGTETTNLAVTLTTHVEFRTSSMLFPLGFSSCTLEDYHASQMALVKMGVFFENPLHLSAIAALVRKGIQTIAPIALPHIVSFAKDVGTRLLSSATKKPDMRQTQMVQPPRPRVKIGKKPKVKRAK